MHLILGYDNIMLFLIPAEIIPGSHSPAFPALDPLLIGIILGAVLGIIVGGLLGFYGYKLIRGKQLVQQAKKAALRDAERTTMAEHQRLHIIYNLISAITSSLNYQRILDNVLDLTNTALNRQGPPSDQLVSAVLLFCKEEGHPTELAVRSARRFTPADTRIRLAGKQGTIRIVLEEGDPCLIQNIDQDPELGRIIAFRACKVIYCTPLRAGLDTYGILLFASPDPDFFSLSRRETLDIVSHQAVIAIQNAQLYSDLEQEKERMMEIQEEARKKLARDLHDGPTQSVAAIAMRVNFARRVLERDEKAATEELVKIEDLARRTTKEIRHMLFTLRPLVLESQGLTAALEAMAEKMQETYNQEVLIEADQSVIPQLEVGKQAVIFYIAEEAVNNARKHAHAPHIWVRLRSLDNNVVLLEIQDDGVGFNLGEVDSFYDQRGSLGLVNMRERAELVNGVLRIDSAEGKGTRVQVVVPLTEEAADRLRSGL